MNTQVSTLCKPKLPFNPRALSISHSVPLIRIIAESPRVIEANYPEVSILSLPIQSDSFDLVVADQVLEHVAGNPFQAFSEAFRVTKENGLCVITSCLINPVHKTPSDFWRFTTEGLVLLAESLPNCSILEAGQWGNLPIWLFLRLGINSYAVPKTKSHPLRVLAEWSEPKWPIVTWLVAQKVLR